MADAILQATTQGMMRFASQLNCIAAQFKNGHMRGTSLSAEEVEGGLTRIVDSLQDIDSEGRGGLLPREVVDNWTLSYSADGGGGLYGPGVRVFSFKKKAL